MATKSKTKKRPAAKKAKRTTKAAARTRAPRANSVLSRLTAGERGFSVGPYKSGHVADSYASQIRRMIRNLGGTPNVEVNRETFAVNVNPDGSAGE